MLLFEGLEPLARHGVSMTHLESRPARNGAWEYNFFVDVEGHIEDEAVKKALTEIKAETAVFKISRLLPQGARLSPRQLLSQNKKYWE